ncbi:hypothetical protein LCGC14_1606830 [marine sediment metagenome]|uniref:Uncharacterized protein n=1 Tax=marine sediment metagenome TaxID=412755 RepID=A0A0F9IW42_9ZZZZ
MNPATAQIVIEKLINDHGPDCDGMGHEIIVKNDGIPEILHRDSERPKDCVSVCMLGKAGMRQGFTAGLWNDMGEALSKAINSVPEGTTNE